MGLTERHWFENEDVPENYEWALEDAVYNSRTNKKVDMVEVVRCKDCKRRGTYNCPVYVGGDGMYSEPDDWFCADGERK